MAYIIVINSTITSDEFDNFLYFLYEVYQNH